MAKAHSLPIEKIQEILHRLKKENQDNSYYADHLRAELKRKEDKLSKKEN